MGMGISGSDPFKSYQSNKDAGGGMGVYARRRRGKKNDDNKDDENLIEMTDDQDDDNLELDMDDADFLE